jgi:hypothetical protein
LSPSPAYNPQSSGFQEPLPPFSTSNPGVFSKFLFKVGIQKKTLKTA